MLNIYQHTMAISTSPLNFIPIILKMLLSQFKELKNKNINKISSLSAIVLLKDTTYLCSQEPKIKYILNL